MKLLSLSLASLLMYLFLLPAAAEAAVKPVQLYLNGKQLTADVPPQIVKDSTLVPVRIIAEALGAEVKWDGAKRNVTVVKDKTTIVLTIDQPAAVVNDKQVRIEAPPVIIEDTTMLPVRFVSEQLDVKVTWDDLTRSVFLFGKLPAQAGVSAAGDMKPLPAQAGEGQPSAASGTAAGADVLPGQAPGSLAGQAAQSGQASGASTGQAAQIGQAPGALPGQAAQSGQASGASTGQAAQIGQAPGALPGQAAQIGQAPGALPGQAVQSGQASNASTGQAAQIGQAPGASVGQAAQPGQAFGASAGQAAQPGQAPGSMLPGQQPAQGGQTGTAPAASDKSVLSLQGGAAQQNPIQSNAVITDIKVEGNQIVVSTAGGEPSPNLSFTEDKNQVIIDYPYAELAPAFKLSKTNQGELATNHAVIEKIQYFLFSTEPSIVRMIIDLPKQVDIRRSAAQTAGKQVFDIRSLKHKVIVDAGHGDKDTGAISITGKYEKQFTLSLALKVSKLLEQEQDIEVIMTRKDDTFLQLGERTGLANNEKADLFVSIHGNYVNRATIGGIETFYYKKDSIPFATALHNAVMPVTGFNDRGVKYGNLHVVRETEMPSALIEIGFLSNKEEEALMYQDDFQNKVAAAIAAAIKETLTQP